jgi:glutamine synthetase
MEHDFDCFGRLVFDDRVMKATLSAELYQKLRRTIDEGSELEPAVADAVAAAMKTWALEHGATHFTHWFQPMTGITAEKHESFISPASDGRIIPEFSGRELIRGEADGSSFPSGGLRATFEARGYTAWDPTSYAFLKGKTLCIPTAFCSYGGEALDKKTPLLRSMDAFNRQALRILRLFGNHEVRKVRTCVGAEQEYFLIDRALYQRRKDLIFTGRTLFGAPPPKGQEMDDHYYGSIKPRVAAYMEELDRELWALGILAKTEHNEVAPSQHELAPVYTTTNIATDQNQLMMDVMRKVALRHDLVCLLHEKPFAGVNGSGKHNNWSVSTDTGINLLSPGDTPYENAQFLLFLCAVIKGVDDYQDLIRISTATAGNDHRLGAHEAPPAVVSIFLGDELTAIMDAIVAQRPYNAAQQTTLKLGVDALPRFARDNTDRNRTSPFAFTGNKFEFRMVGSADSIACANIMINTAVAESLRIFADRLEAAEDFPAALHRLILETFRDHRRIIFNGNGYDQAWLEEAAKRGLCNYPTAADALPHLLDEKNVALFKRHRVYSLTELAARCEALLDHYCKTVHIEAKTMLSMTRQEILPAICAFTGKLAASAAAKRAFAPTLACACEADRVARLSELTDAIDAQAGDLEQTAAELTGIPAAALQAAAIRDRLRPAMDRLRASCDRAEALVPAADWPFPAYAELLFSV